MPEALTRPHPQIAPSGLHRARGTGVNQRMRSPQLWLPPEVPFTVGDVGVSQDVLERAARRGAIVRLGRGVYIHADAVPSEATARHLLQAAARQRLNPDLVGSHGTAALAHDVPLLDRADTAAGPPTFTTQPAPGRRSSRHPRVSLAHLPRRHVSTAAFDLDVTSPVRTAVDLAAQSDLPSGLMALDAVARQLALTLVDDLRQFQDGLDPQLRKAVVEPLLDAAGVVGGHRSARRLAAVLAAVDPRRESPLESFVAGCIHQSELPQPTPQLLVETPEGDLYGDLGWKRYRLVLECDGMLKYKDQRSLHEEKARETRMRRVAYRVERCGWAGVNPDRVSFLLWLEGVLAEQGLRR